MLQNCAQNTLLVLLPLLGSKLVKGFILLTALILILSLLFPFPKWTHVLVNQIGSLKVSRVEEITLPQC